MYWKYLKYIVRHKWFVFIACRKHRIIWRGIMHDLSKFRPSEFIPYARYFYGGYPKYRSGITTKYPHLFKESIKQRFDEAWLLHIHRNPHHWQYWLLQEDDGPVKKISIPISYLKEMGCDWIGAGRAITGKNDIREWYSKNKDKIKLDILNRRWLEKYVINKSS